MPKTGTPATFCSISTSSTRPYWKRCVVMDSSLAWWSKPAPAIGRLGCTSAGLRWKRRWPHPSPSNWPVPTAAIWPVPTGVIWADWPASPTRSPRVAHPAATLPGSVSCTPVPVLPPNADSLLHSAARSLLRVSGAAAPIDRGDPLGLHDMPAPASISPSQAIQIYHHCVRRWQITERFAQPDWSIVDLWVARELLSHGTHPAQVRAILQL